MDENRCPFVRQRTERIRELHLGREHLCWGSSTDLHYLGLSTALKAVSCHLVSWLSVIRGKLSISPASPLLSYWMWVYRRFEENEEGSWRALICFFILRLPFEVRFLLCKNHKVSYVVLEYPFW